jgi:hypothetical protein
LYFGKVPANQSPWVMVAVFPHDFCSNPLIIRIY